jgi:phage recombination protein Bet
MNEVAARDQLAIRPMPELTMEIIKKFVCPSATDQEAYTFLRLCRSQQLNPFLREAYLIKYGTEAASIVVGKETFTKRADRLPQYNGFKAGLILLSGGTVIYREGSFFTSSETLLGGWAEVYRKDRSIPFRNEVKIEEYQGRTKTGEITRMWREKPATMIRKVPLMQSLREAFPDAFGGMYGAEEINTVDAAALPVYEVGKHPAIPAPQEPIRQPQAKQSAHTEATGNDQEGQALVIIADVVIKSGKTGNKSWTKYGIKTDAGIIYGTFDKEIGEVAQQLKGQDAVLRWKREGQYLTCTGIEGIVDVISEEQNGYEREPGDDG